MGVAKSTGNHIKVSASYFKILSVQCSELLKTTDAQPKNSMHTDCYCILDTNRHLSCVALRSARYMELVSCSEVYCSTFGYLLIRKIEKGIKCLCVTNSASLKRSI